MYIFTVNFAHLSSITVPSKAIKGCQESQSNVHESPIPFFVLHVNLAHIYNLIYDGSGLFVTEFLQERSAREELEPSMEAVVQQRRQPWNQTNGIDAETCVLQ